MKTNPKDTDALLGIISAKIDIWWKEYRNDDNIMFYMDQYVRLKPTVENYIFRSEIKYNRRDEKGCIEDLDKAIALDSNNIKAYMEREAAKLDIGDTIGGRRDYHKFTELNDNETYFDKGKEKERIQDYNGAINDFIIAADLHPNDDKIYFEKAILEQKQNEDALAIRDFTKAISINPNSLYVYGMRGLSKGKMEDYRGAIADFNLAIEKNLDKAFFYYSRALAKKQLNDKEGACLDWSKAGELGDDEAYVMIKKYCQ